MAKKTSSKKRTTKCGICGSTFAGSRYLKQHILSKHNNNNENQMLGGSNEKILCSKCGKAISTSHIARHKVICHLIKEKKERKNEKKSFIYFLNFIIKLIMIYNKKVDIANILGDKFEQRRHLYNNENIIEDDENSSRLPAPPKEENESEELSESNNNNDDDNNNESEVESIIKYFNKIKKEEIKTNNKALKTYFAIKTTRINHNKIKIITKNEKINIIKRINIQNDNNNLKYNDGLSDLFLEYIKQFAFTKISCRQVFRYATANDEIIKEADQIINKKINDYPTDEEIKNKDEKINDWLAKTRNNNIFYNENIEKFTLLIKNFLNKNRNNQCEYCLKFTLNMKRHLFQCKKFKNSFKNNKGAMIINYIHRCRPFTKPEVISSAVSYLSKMPIEEIYKNTRGLLKFGLLKKIKENEEKKEKIKEKKEKKIKKKDWVTQIIKEIDENK
jgi:hypothetical protein